MAVPFRGSSLYPKTEDRMFRYLHKIQKNMVHFMGYVELSVTENLISVAAITILFAVRKFLFIHQETYEEEKRRRTGYI